MGMGKGKGKGKGEGEGEGKSTVTGRGWTRRHGPTPFGGLHHFSFLSGLAARITSDGRNRCTLEDRSRHRTPGAARSTKEEELDRVDRREGMI